VTTLHQHFNINQNSVCVSPVLQCVHTTFVYAPSTVHHSSPTGTSHCADTVDTIVTITTLVEKKIHKI